MSIRLICLRKILDTFLSFFLCIVGASADPGGVTMVDSIKIYVKTKESLGWPEDSEDFPEPSASQAKSLPVPSTANGLSSLADSTDSSMSAPIPVTSMDR